MMWERLMDDVNDIALLWLVCGMVGSALNAALFIQPWRDDSPAYPLHAKWQHTLEIVLTGPASFLWVAWMCWSERRSG